MLGERIYDKKAPIEAALETLKEAHKNQEHDALDAAMEVMNTAWSAASEEIYKAGQEAGGVPGAEQGQESDADANGGDNVADADYEEEK